MDFYGGSVGERQKREVSSKAAIALKPSQGFPCALARQVVDLDDKYRAGEQRVT